MKVCVIAASLNIRAKPGLGANILGEFRRGDSVRVTVPGSNWHTVSHDERTAYIAARYTLPEDTPGNWKARVVSHTLNVRAAPDCRAPVFTLVKEGRELSVRFITNGWAHIDTRGITGYVSVNCLAFDLADKTSTRIKSSTDCMNTVRLVHKKFGHLLPALCEEHSLLPAHVMAVLCVESAGQGFSPANRGRMIIRFETHKFYSNWGQHHPDKFAEHFTFNREQPWKGQQWRESEAQPWQDFHGSQKKEWSAFEFACQLDETAAMLSISMGAPQIMGFNYEATGYASVQAMFNAFSSNIEHQVEGFFRFLSPKMRDRLTENDFTGFAALYNGPGQKAKYGELIRGHYLAYQQHLDSEGESPSHAEFPSTSSRISHHALNL